MRYEVDDRVVVAFATSWAVATIKNTAHVNGFGGGVIYYTVAVDSEAATHIFTHSELIYSNIVDQMCAL